MAFCRGVNGGGGKAVLQVEDGAGAQPGGAAAFEDRCQITEDNKGKTDGERRRVNE
jgi:hypothetical protein